MLTTVHNNHQVKKPSEMIAPARWRENAQRVANFIESLGDSKTQRGVLADKYEATLLSLDLKVPAANATSSSSTPRLTGASTSTGAKHIHGHLLNLMSSSAKRPAPTDSTTQPAKKSKLG